MAQWQYSSLKLVLKPTSNVACVISVTAKMKGGGWFVREKKEVEQPVH